MTSLEGYNINTCDQLSGGVSFESIQLSAGSTSVQPSWSTAVDSSACGLNSNSVMIKSYSQVLLNPAERSYLSYTYTPTVPLDSYENINLTVDNEAASDISQTAQLSFPSPTSSVSVTSTDMSANVYPAGSTVTGCYSSCSVNTSYPFAEGSASFSTYQTHFIEVQVYLLRLGHSLSTSRLWRSSTE